MTKNKRIAKINPAKDIINDNLTEFVRKSANKMLKAAIEAEVSEFLSNYSDAVTDDGKQRLVRNGYMPTRQIKSGVGDIEVTMPRVRDRCSNADMNIKFYSNLIPKYMRRTATLDVMLPLLYLKGVSLNNFQDILSPMLGINAKTISPGVISKLKESWVTDFKEWSNRKLTDKKYVYLWVDGVYLSARMETDKTCMLVIVGADITGKKEVVAMVDGFRESKESWKDVLLDLRARGLNYSPDLAIGDGALGFWGAVNEVYPQTKHQRCWVHKTANILDKLPKSIQPQAKSMLHEIYLSSTKKAALLAYDNFIKKFQLKYAKAVNCLSKDREELIAFYDFPSELATHTYN